MLGAVIAIMAAEKAGTLSSDEATTQLNALRSVDVSPKKTIQLL
ncbi:MAG TPA: hypothetical protein VHA52_07715 [Candidatus Babeliaceae bacterium]|nr:hypothetical protein [Candidatus Babeliaceae bacterium]